MKPRARVLIVDARESETKRDLVADLLERHASTFTRHAPAPSRYAIRAESDGLDLVCEELAPDASLQERVKRARGGDVVVVVAGRRTGDALQSLAALHGCGVRRAIVIITGEDAAASDLRENLGRHLLLDAGFDADDAPTLTPRGAWLDAAELARLLAMIESVVVPRADHDFLLTCRFPPERADGLVHGYVCAGAVDAGTFADAAVYDDDWSTAVIDVVTPGRAGDVVALRCDTVIERGDRAIVPAARVASFFASRNRVNIEAASIGRAPFRDGERCIVYGGAGGDVVEATLYRDGAVTLAGGVALVDDRLILARQLGGFWRVTSAPIVRGAADLDDKTEETATVTED